MGGGSETVETIESKPLEQKEVKSTSLQSSTSTRSGNTVTDYAIVASKTRSGSRPAGWIVRMFEGGKLVKVQASSPAYEQIARDPAQLDALVKNLQPGTTNPQTNGIPGRPPF